MGCKDLMYIVMFVSKLLFFIGIKIVLRLLSCCINLWVIVFWLIIILGLLNGGINILLCCFVSFKVWVFVVLKWWLCNIILLFKVCIVLILILGVVIGIIIVVLCFKKEVFSVMFCVWLLVEVVIILDFFGSLFSLWKVLCNLNE